MCGKNFIKIEGKMETYNDITMLKFIPFFGTSYSISDKGDVFSSKSGSLKPKKLRINDAGYMTVNLNGTSDPEKSKNKRKVHCYLVHRLVAFTWVSRPNDLPFVNHKDGNKQNNNAENLEWVTHKENCRHARDILGYKGYCRPVVRADLNGLFLARYNSLKDAQKHTGLSSKNISQVCQGKRRKAGESVWFYEENFVEGVPMRKLAQCKKVEQYSLDGVLLKTFESVQDASKRTKVGVSNISNACNGRLKSSKGYIWKYRFPDKNIDETEDWIILPNFPKDKISEDGRIFSIWGKRFKKQGCGKYKRVGVVNSQLKSVTMLVHRLVATAYIPNPLKLPFVNHIDGDPSNNNVENLEWCTAQQNIQHAYDTGLNQSRKTVLQFDLEGNKLGEFVSTRHAAEIVGVTPNAISHACRFSTPSVGFKWKYKN